MTSPSKINDPDVEKLNRKHQELGQIKQKHGVCRRKTGQYGAIGGMLLACSSLGSFHYVTSQESDWSKNPNSPVYSLAQQAENGFEIPISALLAGFVVGLGMFFKARKHFVRQEHLWISENLLILEIRQMQDRLYPKASKKPKSSGDTDEPSEHAMPLPADQARSEYMGVYSPQTHQTHH